MPVFRKNSQLILVWIFCKKKDLCVPFAEILCPKKLTKAPPISFFICAPVGTKAPLLSCHGGSFRGIGPKKPAGLLANPAVGGVRRNRQNPLCPPRPFYINNNKQNSESKSIVIFCLSGRRLKTVSFYHRRTASGNDCQDKTFNSKASVKHF